MVVGGKILLLLPSESNKLLLQWNGPYEVVDVVNVVNYSVVNTNPANTYDGDATRGDVTPVKISPSKVAGSNCDQELRAGNESCKICHAEQG